MLVLEWAAAPPAVQLAWVGPSPAMLAQTPQQPSAFAAVIGATGKTGKTGPAGAEAIIERIGGEAIGGHRGVWVDGAERAWLAQPEDASAVNTIGISVAAASSGEIVQIRTAGQVSEPSWSWSTGRVYLAPDGVLTQTIPTSGYLVRLGTALGPTTLVLAPEVIAKL